MSTLPSPQTFFVTSWAIITAPAYRKTTISIGLTYALVNALILGLPPYLPLPTNIVFTLIYTVLTFTIPLYTMIVVSLIFMTMLESKPIAPLASYLLSARLRFGKVFWVSLLTAFAVMAGILLLVIPGIILSIRLWSASILAIIDPTLKHPMKTSWNITKGKFFPILIRYFLFSAVGVIPVFLLQKIHPLAAYVGYILHPYTLLLSIMLTYELRKS